MSRVRVVSSIATRNTITILMTKSDHSLSETQVRVEINDQSRIIELGLNETENKDGFSLRHVHGKSWSVLFKGKSISATLTDRTRNMLSFSIGGVPYTFRVTNRRAQLLEELGVGSDSNEFDGDISAPMPGLVIKVHVALGDIVSAGDALVVLEAMKMENEIRAPFDARVTNVDAQPGLSVTKNTSLVSLERL